MTVEPMTPRERAQFVLRRMRAGYWSSAGLLDEVEHAIIDALDEQRQRVTNLERDNAMWAESYAGLVEERDDQRERIAAFERRIKRILVDRPDQAAFDATAVRWEMRIGQLHEEIAEVVGQRDNAVDRVVALEDGVLALVAQWRLCSDPYHALCAEELKAAVQTAYEASLKESRDAGE